MFGPRLLADGREAYDFRYREAGADGTVENKSVTKYSLEAANQLARDHRSDYVVDDLLPDTTLGEYFRRKDTQESLQRIHGLGTETRGYWSWMWKKHINHGSYGIAVRPVRELGHGAPIHKFLNGMDRAGVGESMQVRVLGVVSAILDVATEENPPLLLANPIPRLTGRPTGNQRRSIFIPTIEMIEQLRWEVLHGGSERYRGDRRLDALLISMFAYIAPRPEELAILPRSDVHTDREEVDIHAPKAERGKSSAPERSAPLNTILAGELADWLEDEPLPGRSLVVATRHKAGWPAGGYRNWRRRVFKPALERMADKLAANDRERERIVGIRPYDLRHTGLSLWLANGGKDEEGEWDGSPANVVDVAEWGGHRPRTLLDHYAHRIKTWPKVPIARQVEDARDAVAAREEEIAEDEKREARDRRPIRRGRSAGGRMARPGH